MDRTLLRQVGWMAASLGLSAILGGCGEIPDDATSEDFARHGASLALANGLAAVNGLAASNGLASSNGLALANGLASSNGLAASNGLMTTDNGRRTVAYLVRCALYAGDSLTKQDQNGKSYTFQGALGLCPAWKYGGIYGTPAGWQCQELVSACMMAHLNTAGIHVPIWLDANPQTTIIGWGMSALYPYQEGTFLGNILATGNMNHGNVPAPAGYYCDGDGFSQGINGVVAGRIGDTSSDAYKNPWGNGTLCKNVCTGQYSLGWAPDPDGYINCAPPAVPAFNNMITVWRSASYTP